MSPNVDVAVDAGARTAMITTRFDRPIEAVWTLWSDPDKLARWWGPPGLPMTVDHHDLRPGGGVEVTVRADDFVIRAQWSIHAVDPPRSLRFTFEGEGLDPTEIDVALHPDSLAATTMILTASFTSDAAYRRAREIGFVEGLTRSCESAPAAL